MRDSFLNYLQSVVLLTNPKKYVELASFFRGYMGHIDELRAGGMEMRNLGKFMNKEISSEAFSWNEALWQWETGKAQFIQNVFFGITKNENESYFESVYEMFDKVKTNYLTFLYDPRRNKYYEEGKIYKDSDLKYKELY